MLEQLKVYFMEECESIDISNELKYKGYLDLSGFNHDELWIHANEYGFKEQRQIFYDCCYNKLFYDYYLDTSRNIVFHYNPFFDWQSYDCSLEIHSEYYALNQYISKHNLSNSLMEFIDISDTNPQYSILSECASYDYKTFPFAYGAGQWSSGSFGVIVPCKSIIKRVYFMYLYDTYENYSTNYNDYNFNNDKTKIRLDLYLNGSISEYYIQETLDPSINMLGVLFKKNTINNKTIIVDYNEIIIEENTIISWYCSDLVSKTLDNEYTNYPYNPYRNRLIMILEPFQQNNKITQLEKEIKLLKEYLQLK